MYNSEKQEALKDLCQVYAIGKRVSVDDIKRKSNEHRVVSIRRGFIQLAYSNNFTDGTIAEFLGFDRTTILHHRKVARDMQDYRVASTYNIS